MRWGGCCVEWGRTSRLATATARGWWRPSSRPRATPARSTGRRAGPVSERLRGAGATIAISSTTSPGRTSGYAPSERIGNAPSIAKINRSVRHYPPPSTASPNAYTPHGNRSVGPWSRPARCFPRYAKMTEPRAFRLFTPSDQPDQHGLSERLPLTRDIDTTNPTDIRRDSSMFE